MEKQVYELQIDPVFENAIYPLTEAEFDGLKSDILKNGCTDPIMVWRGFIADGHNRYKICRENNVPFAVEEVPECETKEDVLVWMFERALGRRNMTDYTKTVMGLHCRVALEKRAEARSKAGKKLDPCNNSDRGRTLGMIGKSVGKSHDYVNRVMKLEAEAPPEMREKLHRGELTVNKAYTALFRKSTGKKEKAGSPDQKEAILAGTEAVGFPEHEAMEPTKVDGEIIPSMGSKDGYTMHTGGGLEDTPDSADAILFEIETALNSFELSVQDALERYTHGMASEGVNTEILSMLKKTTKNTVAYATKYLKEVLKNE